MAGEALFLGWGPVVRGREQKALQVFQETIEYYGKLQQEGQIDSFEPVLIAPHGGDLGGFVLLRGERAKLDRDPRQRGLRAARDARCHDRGQRRRDQRLHRRVARTSDGPVPGRIQRPGLTFPVCRGSRSRWP